MEDIIEDLVKEKRKTEHLTNKWHEAQKEVGLQEKLRGAERRLMTIENNQQFFKCEGKVREMETELEER